MDVEENWSLPYIRRRTVTPLYLAMFSYQFFVVLILVFIGDKNKNKINR